MHKFILASGNAHKAEEFSTLFDKEIIEIVASDKKLDVVEDGTSFNENAFKKAHAYYEEFKSPVMADDSGLCVEALPDELGLYTARYGGEGLSGKERSELLVKNMKDIENRKAYFVCVLCFYLSPDEIYYFEGRLQGEISKEYRGNQGFGYDPVFLPEGLPGGRTLAEDPLWKEDHSHRSKACEQAQRFFAAQIK
tara:strand:- start:922 stop:1506 length:585 start_codon:yes stop_codon:yes gene_type:complete